ncbi:hypothetical protein DdX_19113 [Ditylenchus destructor]|uniref:Uncharacterized protein n=1 Tax=Ditylenchus destructor TaxID=166010 RepID=A0AAD4MKA7_9BILA|nr:hypothetical protein DdX_19113 [Ditylenchus destructor]
MRILSVILLLVLTYITVNSQFLPSNKVQVQKTSELISTDYGEENRELAYNKGAQLVRKKRSILATVLVTFGLPYLCYVLVNVTPIDGSLKRWALKYWGFREGQEGRHYKELAKLVRRNVPLDADGNLDEINGIRNFIDAPSDLENQVERFRMEATLTMTKIMEDEAEEEARMKEEEAKRKQEEARMKQEEARRKKESEEYRRRGVRRRGAKKQVKPRTQNENPVGQAKHAPVILSKVKKWEDLDQITKAMMADNMIFTLLSINGTGETTWKVNPNNKEHREIYEALLKIKEAIDRKYKDQCPLKKITAEELPEFKAWYVRLLGGVPDWFSKLFKGVDAPKHEPIKMSAKLEEELTKKIHEIRAMAEQALEAVAKAKEARKDSHEKMKLTAQLAAPLKTLVDAVKVLPTKEEHSKSALIKPKQGAALFPTPAQLQNKIHPPVAKGRNKNEDDMNYPYINVADLIGHN